MPHILDNKELLIHPEFQTLGKTRICVISTFLSVFSLESTSPVWIIGSNLLCGVVRDKFICVILGTQNQVRGYLLSLIKNICLMGLKENKS